MKYPFQSIAQRMRSWFTPRKPRTFQHRCRPHMEQLEDRTVPTTMTLSGAASVAEGSPYALTLGPVMDTPGAVSQYVVHWGDTETDTNAAADLPADRPVPATDRRGPTA